MRFSRTGLFSNTRFRTPAQAIAVALLVFGWLDFAALNYSLAALPVVAAAWAPPLEPLQAYAPSALEELLEARAVPVYSVVVVIPPEFAVQLLEQHSEPPLAILPTPLGAARQGRPQLRARRAPLQLRLPRPIRPPAKLKPQEFKAARSWRRRAAEGEEAGLRGRQGPPEFLQAWPQGRVEPLRFPLVRNRAAVILRVSEPARFPPTLWLDPFRKPQVEHLVQVPVGQHG